MQAKEQPSDYRNEKSGDPSAVPPKIKVVTAGIGPYLARAAAANGRTLSEEIRQRLIESLRADGIEVK